MRILAVAALVTGALVGIGGATPLAHATTTCPPNPPSGSTIYGGLIVNGPCVLNNVTVYGNVTINPNGQLELSSSTINGSITDNGGELDIQHDFAFTVLAGHSTVTGAITLNNASDFDLLNFNLGGNLVTGGGSAFPTMCGATVGGSVTFQNASYPSLDIGDPDEMRFPTGNCPGNTIGGNLTITNTPNMEFEGNTVKGSAVISGSAVNFEDNTIQGNLSCGSGGSIFGTDNNHVSGHNSC